MALNGISELPDKYDRQIAKLTIAQAKRQGKTVAADGTISGTVDDTKPFYREWNEYDRLALARAYASGGTASDLELEANTYNPLLPHRPWIGATSGIVATTVQEAVSESALVDLQVWYDAADTTTIIPSATDEQDITQINDKSNYAHNAKPTGGSKPSYENTVLQNGYGYLEFDGGDYLSVSPAPYLSSIQGATIFVVANPAAGTATPSYLSSTNEGGLSVFYNGTNWAVNTAGGTGVSPVTLNNGSFSLYALVYDGTLTGDANRLKFRYNGTQQALDFSADPGVGGSTSVDADTLYWGARDNTQGYFTGFIGEMIMFTRALSAPEIANIEAYLTNKWSL